MRDLNKNCLSPFLPLFRVASNARFLSHTRSYNCFALCTGRFRRSHGLIRIVFNMCGHAFNGRWKIYTVEIVICTSEKLSFDDRRHFVRSLPNVTQSKTLELTFLSLFHSESNKRSRGVRATSDVAQLEKGTIS